MTMTLTQLDALAPELDAWNARQQAARIEYDAHPSAMCDGYPDDCDRTAPYPVGALCGGCTRNLFADLRNLTQKGIATMLALYPVSAKSAERARREARR